MISTSILKPFDFKFTFLINFLDIALNPVAQSEIFELFNVLKTPLMILLPIKREIHIFSTFPFKKEQD